MKFPGFLRKSNPDTASARSETSGSTSGNSSESQWDTLKQVEFQAKNLSERHGSMSRETLELIRRNIVGIATPVDQYGKDEVFAGLSDKHSLRILSFMTGQNFNNYQETTSDSLETFLETYPTPVDFYQAESNFLDSIREHNSPEKYLSYVQDMANFKKKVYGGREEAYEDILDGSRAIMYIPEDIAPEAPHATPDEPPERPLAAPERPLEKKEPSYSTLDSERAEGILKRATIDGDPYIYNGESYVLSPENLKNLGLEPKYNVTFDNADISLSDSYKIGTRSIVTAYVNSEDGVKVRSYYRSNSAGTWRYLPDYVGRTDSENTAIGWYGKGRSEESLTLPTELQVALDAISSRPPVEMNRITAEYTFAGTAKRYNSKAEYSERLHAGTLSGDYYTEVDSSPVLTFGRLQRDAKENPATLDFQGPADPDFSTYSDASYQISGSSFGTATVDHFLSKSGDLKYSFCRDDKNRAWISAIEPTRGKITSTGLRSEWVEAGDYCTPLYEYASQSAGYGDTSDTRGNYTSMWPNYLSKMPVVQKYLNSLENSAEI